MILPVGATCEVRTRQHFALRPCGRRQSESTAHCPGSACIATHTDARFSRVRAHDDCRPFQTIGNVNDGMGPRLHLGMVPEACQLGGFPERLQCCVEGLFACCCWHGDCDLHTRVWQRLLLPLYFKGAAALCRLAAGCGLSCWLGVSCRPFSRGRSGFCGGAARLSCCKSPVLCLSQPEANISSAR